MLTSGTVHAGIDSPMAWWRLVAVVVLGTIGSVGMWSVPVVLPAVQAEFGVARADASLPYTLAMIGFAFGGVAMGRLSDRFGIVTPVLCGALALGIGFLIAGFALHSHPVRARLCTGRFRYVRHFRAADGGHFAMVRPVARHRSRPFRLRQLPRRRGLAACPASFRCDRGLARNPCRRRRVLRAQHVAVSAGVAAPRTDLSHDSADAFAAGTQRGLGLSPKALQVLLCIAGLSCCVAMSMPQVHIVAYCGDLGYGVARGAEMLSLMLGFGIFSRVASGFIADRIGGVATLLLGSVLQALALLLYLFFDGLVSLYVISALFGLFQGGIVPMYAIIVREYFPPQEAGTRLGIVLMATLFGMALGGWMSGVIFDLTGSYQAAFVNGLLWNLVNILIAAWLLMRPGRRVAPA